jgi:hypothetical protein
MCAVFLPGLAQAYVGPGVGLSALGSVLAFIGAVLLLIVGFLWYPIKRLLKGRSRQGAEKSAAGKAEARQNSDH